MGRDKFEALKAKVSIKYSHWAFRLPLLRNYSGIVVGRQIWFKHPKGKVSEALVRHELVHQEQMTRVSIPLFYLIYLRDYLKNLMHYRNHDKAYREIPFEIEARGELKNSSIHADK